MGVDEEEKKGCGVRLEESRKQGPHWQFLSWSRAADMRTKFPQTSNPIYNIAHR